MFLRKKIQKCKKGDEVTCFDGTGYLLFSPSRVQTKCSLFNVRIIIVAQKVIISFFSILLLYCVCENFCHFSLFRIQI